jgi:hypothetical protein
MAQFGDNVTVVNRTQRSILSAQWDGAHFHFEPGETQNVPLPIAMAAYKQNPIHGTEDPLGDPNLIQSLIGIKGARLPYGDIGPVEQSTAGERLNRSMVMGLGADVKQINAGGPTYFDAKAGTESVNLQDDADASSNAPVHAASDGRAIHEDNRPSRSRK